MWPPGSAARRLGTGGRWRSTTARRALVLQHHSAGSLGLYAESLAERGVVVHRILLEGAAPLPDWRAFDLLVVLGGPMSVNDEGRFPWLAREKLLIRDAVRAGVPYWGVCLGAQLLAASLGARVFRGARAEVGLVSVIRAASAAADPVFASAPRRLRPLQWHRDTFELPPGSVRLAASPAYTNQAFRWGERAYGVQFHLEATSAMLAEWARLADYRDLVDASAATGGVSRLIAELDETEDERRRQAQLLLGGWLDSALGFAFVGEGSAAR